MEQQSNLELSCQKYPQIQTAHTDQAPDYPTTDTELCAKQADNVCWDTSCVSTQGPVGLPAHCALPDPIGFYIQTTQSSQKPSPSTTTFVAQGLLVLSRLAQCIAVTLQHFQGHRSWGPQLHPEVTLPPPKWGRRRELDAKIACGSLPFAP